MQQKDNIDLQKSQNTIPSTLIFSQHFRVTMMVALITLLTITIFGFVGYQVDQFYGISPAFTIVGAVLSFPFSQYFVYKWVKTRYVPRIKKFSQDNPS